MIHGKAIWKPGISEISKASRNIVPGPHNGSLQHAIWTPSCKGSMCWCTLGYMVYGHKTQSFMKNGGHQKCLDKALFEIIGFHNSKYFLNVLFKNLIANWCWNRVYLYWFTAMILSIVNHIPLQLDNSFTQQKAPQLILSWKDFLADFLFEP